MSTVVLDHDQKNQILADVNEYLHPSTPKWYADRGIPYRRGYLFHGPPGTRKSSLAWAIAGIFGVNVYCISLADPTLTEEDLAMPFTNLPRRCVVLLEDIDAAGLNKRQEPKHEEEIQDEGSASRMGAEITKAFKAVQDGDKEKKGINLSGLLNAVDGVASHGGRVLILTSNFPDKLDDALVRPGGIDVKTSFTGATHSQIKELFMRMYSPDTSRTPDSGRRLLDPVLLKDSRPMDVNPNNFSIGNIIRPKPVATSSGTPKQAEIPTIHFPSPDSIEAITVQFAYRLPEYTFTPAEIQGYLLTRKKEPKRALVEVEVWKEATLEAGRTQVLAKKDD